MTAQIFNRPLLRHRRARAAGREGVDFLTREIYERLTERLLEINRSFPLALELGSRGVLRPLLPKGVVGELVQADACLPMVTKAEGIKVCLDEEHLPFAPGMFDLVISGYGLNWVNDLPGMLAQVQRILKPDGLFIALFPGGETLHELRSVLLEHDIATSGGAAARLSPAIDVRDAGALLQRAGFALPVADSERLTIRYENPLTLLQDLHEAGESNALLQRGGRPLTRGALAQVAERYLSRYAGEDGRVPATLELIGMAGWKPHASQQQPAARGSGKVSLRDVLQGGEGQ